MYGGNRGRRSRSGDTDVDEDDDDGREEKEYPHPHPHPHSRSRSRHSSLPLHRPRPRPRPPRTHQGKNNLLTTLNHYLKHISRWATRRRGGIAISPLLLLTIFLVLLLLLVLVFNGSSSGSARVGGGEGGGGGGGGGWWFTKSWTDVEGDVERGIGGTEMWRGFRVVEGWERGVGRKGGGGRRYDPYGMEGGVVECDYHDYDGGVVGRRRERPEVWVYDVGDGGGDGSGSGDIKEGFPEPVFGGYGVIGLESEKVCFERRGRLGGYGFGYGRGEGGLGGSGGRQKIDWRGVDWGGVQRRCVERNKGRFRTTSGSGRIGKEAEEVGGVKATRSGPGKVDRTAVLMRTWDDYKYTDNDILNLRSLISELAVNTGGEYQVHLLVHVKDPKIPIWADTEFYNSHLEKSVPREFWGIATLWNEPLMELVYASLPENRFRDLPLHGVYRSSFMPVQWFATRHPEYEFFWNWEMDVRFTGHWYELFEKVGVWAKAQKRRYLWERNDRFYIPSIHGSYEDFEKRVEREVNINETIWGPVKVPGVALEPDDPTPPPHAPTAYHEEADIGTPWGVGEDADLIVFNPLFDAQHTDWLLALDTTGYTDPPPPRRSAIIASSRLSRRLLKRMHSENAHHGHAAFTEMWPATCALHHGMKAVYIPHPVYMDRKWPSLYLEKTFNHGVGGSTGGRRESVFGPREHNFAGTTWYYNSVFGPELYGKWVGGGGKGMGKGEKEGMCMRGVLVHPVKNVPDLEG